MPWARFGENGFPPPKIQSMPPATPLPGTLSAVSRFGPLLQLLAAMS